jgi:hypothetical protein
MDNVVNLLTYQGSSKPQHNPEEFVKTKKRLVPETNHDYIENDYYYSTNAPIRYYFMRKEHGTDADLLTPDNQ